MNSEENDYNSERNKIWMNVVSLSSQNVFFYQTLHFCGGERCQDAYIGDEVRPMTWTERLAPKSGTPAHKHLDASV